MLWELKEKSFPDLKELEGIKVMDLKRRRDNKAVRIHETMENLFEKVRNQNFVPVVDDENVFIGIVTRKDVFVYLAKQISHK